MLTSRSPVLRYAIRANLTILHVFDRPWKRTRTISGANSTNTSTDGKTPEEVEKSCTTQLARMEPADRRQVDAFATS